MNKKITLEEFFEMESACVHCKTITEAKELLNAFRNSDDGIWHNKNSYLSGTEWYRYKNKTCYSNYERFCNIEYYQENNYEIFEFEDIVDLTTSNEESSLEWNLLLKISQK